jgi:hypothetical protein
VPHGVRLAVQLEWRAGGQGVGTVAGMWYKQWVFGFLGRWLSASAPQTALPRPETLPDHAPDATIDEVGKPVGGLVGFDGRLRKESGSLYGGGIVGM